MYEDNDCEVRIWLLEAFDSVNTGVGRFRWQKTTYRKWDHAQQEIELDVSTIK